MGKKYLFDIDGDNVRMTRAVIENGHYTQCSYTGMDKTSLGHQLWEFICEGLCPGVHVTSDGITYHCSACRRRGTIERRLMLLRNK